MSEVRCERCRKKLTLEESVERAHGAICYRKILWGAFQKVAGQPLPPVVKKFQPTIWTLKR